MARVLVPQDCGKCIDMASSSSRVTFTVPAALDPANIPAFSWAFWMFPRAVDGTARRITDPNGAAGAGVQAFVSTTAGLAVKVMHTVQNAEQDTGPGAVLKNQWSRVVMTWTDAGTVPLLYVNGVQYNAALQSAAKSGSRANWSGSTAYVGNTSGLAAAFNGRLDRYCFWNRVLTAQEISDDFYLGRLATSGLVLCWEMEEAAAAGTVADTGSSGTAGTATSVTQGAGSYSIPARIAA